MTSNPLAIHGLVSENAVPAITVAGVALLVLIDATLTGGNPGAVAIDNRDKTSRFYLRQVTTSGYLAAVRNRGQTAFGANIDELSSDPVLGLPGGPSTTAPMLPIAETPTVCDADVASWGKPTASGSDDDTADLQAALDRGTPTVYFPNGIYKISAPLRVPPTVKHIIGLDANIQSVKNATAFADPNQPTAALRLEGESSDVLLIEGLRVGAMGPGGVGIECATTRPVVLADLALGGTVDAYRSNAGCGDLFLEDVTGNLHLGYAQKVWARQLSVLAEDSEILNNGGSLWILGLRSQRSGVSIRTRNGGNTEVLGGTVYSAPRVVGTPIFSTESGGSARLSFTGTWYLPGFFTVLVHDHRDGRVCELPTSAAYWRGLSTSVPLYVGPGSPAPEIR